MRGTAMYIGGGGALWRKYKQQNNTKFKDNMNPDYGVYIVLFLMRFIRGPPLCVLLFTINFKGANAMKNDKNKKIKIFSEKVGKTGSQFRDYNIEAQNPVQKFLNKEKTVVINKGLKVNQFKKHIRISLNNFRIDIYRLYKKMYEKEYLTDETAFVDNALYDDYDFLENKVAVMDFKMTVKNDLLYEVLNSLEQHQRDIIYLSLCEEMSDMEIGKKLKMSRSKVQRIKQKLKKEIYNAMTGGKDDE